VSKKRIPKRLTTAPVEEGLRASINIGDQVFAFQKAYRVIGFRGERVLLERKCRAYHKRKARV
jgi:hypothetical protein